MKKLENQTINYNLCSTGIDKASEWTSKVLEQTELSVAVSMLSAALIGIFLNLFFPQEGELIYQSVITPLFDTMMNLLSTIAGPLIFLAVCSGVYGIGDIALFGKIGKKIISRFIMMTYVFLAGTLCCVMALFSVDSNGMEISNLVGGSSIG